ncbi:MAG: hypothetical protein RL701_1544, partial [Pseudomonadota bacterium]
VPDLVLLDIELPGMNGFDVCKAMKGTAMLAEVPIIFITSDPDYVALPVLIDCCAALRRLGSDAMSKPTASRFLTRGSTY